MLASFISHGRMLYAWSKCVRKVLDLRPHKRKTPFIYSFIIHLLPSFLSSCLFFFLINIKVVLTTLVLTTPHRFVNLSLPRIRDPPPPQTKTWSKPRTVRIFHLRDQHTRYLLTTLYSVFFSIIAFSWYGGRGELFLANKHSRYRSATCRSRFFFLAATETFSLMARNELEFSL